MCQATLARHLAILLQVEHTDNPTYKRESVQLQYRNDFGGWVGSPSYNSHLSIFELRAHPPLSEGRILGGLRGGRRAALGRLARRLVLRLWIPGATDGTVLK